MENNYDTFKLLLGSEALCDLLKEKAATEATLEGLVKKFKDQEVLLNSSAESLTVMNRQLLVLQEKEASVVARETQVTEEEFQHRILEVESSFQATRGDEFKDLLGSALRNTEIRRSMMDFGSVTSEGKTNANGVWEAGTTEHRNTNSTVDITEV